MHFLNISIEDLLQGMINAAREAGTVILEVYKSDAFEVQLKSDDSPLTLADQRSNDLIMEHLKKLLPDVPIISEETKMQPYEVRQNYDTFWMVDPLDGTKEFIKRNGEFTVNIALGRGNKILAGVIYVPVLGEMFFAAEAFGAYKGDINDRTRIHAAGYHPSETGLVIAVSRSHLSEPTQAFLRSLESPETLASGSSLKFMRLADGTAHIYPRLGPTMEWDTAAAQIILEEAGGSVLTWEGQGPLKYNKENLLNPYFIAKAAEKHA